MKQYAERIAAAGIDLMTIFMGALADPAFQARVSENAPASGAQIIIPAGAVGGLDALAAVRHDGIDSVTFRSTKPPGAWMGTAAEKAVDLSKLTEPVCYFKGDAHEAASATKSSPKGRSGASSCACSARRARRRRGPRFRPR